MKITSLSIPGVLLIEPQKHQDKRGFFSEVYRHDVLLEHGFPRSFVQDNHSYSAEIGVLRGLHFQTPPFAQDKLVRVIRGAIWDVAVDIREGSPTYGDWIAEEISAENFKQVLIPVGFAHGFVTLEPNTEVLYKVTNPYSAECNGGLAWDDPDLAIDWPLENRELSLIGKDKTNPSFSSFKSPFKYGEAFSS